MLVSNLLGTAMAQLGLNSEAMPYKSIWNDSKISTGRVLIEPIPT